MALRDWFRRRGLDEADLEDEIRSHLTMAAQDRMADGADREAARRASLKEFGNVTLTMEAARRVWRPWWVDAIRDLAGDVAYAGRLIRKSPAFSLIVVAVLAVGIGLNAAVFTLVKSLALRPIAGVASSGRLAVVLDTTSAGRQVPISYPAYQDLREHGQSFADLTASTMSDFSLGLGQRGERVFGELVAGNYFQFLGVGASHGRTLLPSDEVAPGMHPVVVLSDALWRRAFGSDPDIVGRTIHLNGHPMTVVGVADAAFHGTVVGFDIELFVPVMMASRLGELPETPGMEADPLYNRAAEILMVHGRLRPGVTIDTAAARTAALSAQLAEKAPVGTVSRQLTVLPIWESPFGAQTYMLPALLVSGAMGALLLGVVCANIAGLVLVRGVSRRGEVAVRLALGASRIRILRLLFVESLLLAVPGAAAGLLLTQWALPLMWSAAGQAAPVRVFLDVSTDGLVVGFAIAAASASAVLFGFVPALRSSRVDLVSVMKDGLSPRTARRGRLRAALVVSQVAVSLLLLTGAALVARSLDAARRADAGFDPTDAISVTIDLSHNGYDETTGSQFYARLLDTMRARPGVASASLATTYPMMVVDGPAAPVAIEGHEPRDGEDPSMLFNIVAPEYFRTLGIRLVAGREFTDGDDPTARQVAVVNETLARRFWGNPADALGQQLRVASGPSRTVIGVAHDVKYSRINEEPRPYVYVPFLQSYQPAMILHARGPAGVAALLDEARASIQEIEPNLPILEARSLGEQTGAALAILEMSAAMLVMFGAAALALAAMSVYGLVSYAVRLSTHEIGIRMALGARRIDVIRYFLGRGLGLSALGAALGIGAAFGVAQLLGALLYGVSPTDLVSFGVAAVVVLAASTLAALVPARRAARTSPMTALRHQ